MQSFQILIVAAVAITLFPCFISAQGITDYPIKPVRVIVPSAPGSLFDVVGRLIAVKLSENLKRQFVFDYRPGGGTTTGAGLAAKSTPDGYTLLAVAPSFTFGPALRLDLSYDPVKDFVPISLFTKAPSLLIAHPSLPVKSVKELIALARAKPSALDMGVGQSGSFSHLTAAYFSSAANIKVTIIPYKSSGQVMVDAIAGEIHIFFGAILIAMPHVKSGRLRALGVSSAERSSVLPELSTISESGVRGFDATTWIGWVAPAGTPATIIGKLSAELAKAVRSPDVANKLTRDGGEILGSTPEQFQQLIAAEVPRWSKVVRDSGMLVE